MPKGRRLFTGWIEQNRMPFLETQGLEAFPPDPKVSILVDASRPAEHVRNTLVSFSTACQRHVTNSDYEIVVVEPVSEDTLGAESTPGLGSNVRYVPIDVT